jgi:SAM-dependent methyltransferase
MAVPVVNRGAQTDFERLVRESGLDPNNRWIGGYVEEVWRSGRHVFECADFALPTSGILEFGCNVGGTAIVLGLLGARVTAIDPNPTYVRIARANAARYGVQDRIEFLHVRDTRRLPFGDGTFHVVSCSSVLEYVAPGMLAETQREIDRVVAPGGIIVVTGTSNRLWPRYLPIRRPSERGVSPWRVRYGFGDYENLDRLGRGQAYLRARQRMARGRLLRGALLTANALSLAFGTSVGLLTPTISVTLRKLGRQGPRGQRTSA